MIERILTAMAIKLLEVAFKWAISRIDRYSKKIEKYKNTEEKKEILLKGIKDASTKAERIKSALDAINA